MRGRPCGPWTGQPIAVHSPILVLDWTLNDLNRRRFFPTFI
jgi:hypothetical protein